MSDEYIWAYTPPSDGSWKHYPPFVNLSRKGGKFVITMRAKEDLSGEYPNAGAWTEIVIPDEEIDRLKAALTVPA